MGSPDTTPPGIGLLMDLVYGSALWGGSTKVNCHHLAEQLAQRGPVVFVESVGARLPNVREWRRLGPRLVRSLVPLRRIGPNLWLFSPLPLPLYRGKSLAVNSRWVGRQVGALLRLRGWRLDTSWVFHPMGLGAARRAKARGLIYYCIDDYSSNPGTDPTAIRALERELVKEADVTLVTGSPLAERLRPLARRILVLPNVIDTELFGVDASSEHNPVVMAIDRLPRPRVGYLGNLAAYKIDIDLIFEIARRRPAWSVVLVGPRNQGDVREAINKNGSPPNVAFAGEVPHRLAPAVIDRFDVALLPAAHHEVMLASFPLKFFEYLSRGRPVVARPLPALDPFREWYYEAVTADDFVAAIERRLAVDSPADADRRRLYAQRFAWHDRMVFLRQLREELLSQSTKRGSVSSDLEREQK